MPAERQDDIARTTQAIANEMKMTYGRVYISNGDQKGNKWPWHIEVVNGTERGDHKSKTACGLWFVAKRSAFESMGYTCARCIEAVERVSGEDYGSGD